MFKLHSFFPFFNHIMSFLFGAFAVGSDALAAIGGAEGPVIDASVDAPDESAADDASRPSAGKDSEENAESESGDDSPLAPEDQRVDGKADQAQGDNLSAVLSTPLSPKDKDALKMLKKTDRRAWKAVSDKIWALNKINKEMADHFPESGLDEAIRTKAKLDGFLGKAGYPDLAGVEAELQDYRSADTKMVKGDPTFVNDLPADVQTGLYKMMPHFLQEWSQRDMGAYERFFGSVFVATLRDSGAADGIRYALRDLQRLGLENAEIKDVYDQLKNVSDWMDNLRKRISAPVESPKAPAQEDHKLSERERTVAQRERGLAVQRIGSEFNRIKVPEMLKVLASHYGGKVPAYVNRGEVVNHARHELVKILGSSYSQKLDRYMEAGDEVGAVKFTLQQVTEQRIRHAIERAAKYLYGQPTLGSKTRKTDGAAKAQSGAGTRQNPPGVTTIRYNPRPASIDLTLSDKWARELGISRSRLFTSNRAVLKGGKRVTWSADAEDEA
jgi:hypothetical protein